MTLPEFGNLTLLDLKTEFGGNASPKLTDYYAGGSFVSAGAKDKDGNPIPSSGTIKLSNFYGAPNPVNLADLSVSEADVTATRAGIQLRTDGRLDKVTFLNNTYFYTNSVNQWYIPNTTGIGSSYQVKATPGGGNTIYGSALNTWLTISSNLLWEVRSPSSGVSTNTIILEIRKINTTTVLASASYFITARRLL